MKTSSETYRDLQLEIAGKIEQLTLALRAHKEKQDKNPLDWGYVGDLNSINNHFGNLLKQLDYGTY